MSRRSQSKPQSSPAPAVAATPAVSAPAKRSPVPWRDGRLWLILALSALLGLGFLSSIPVGANPDESAHLQYVRVLATEHRLPSLDLSRPRDRDRDLNYEAHQPPLYYVLATPLYHVGAAVQPEHGPGYAARVLSLLIGLLGTALVWCVARELVPNRPALWVAATSIAAFLPMRLALNASVSNDAAAEATGTLALLIMLRGLRGHWAVREWALLGGALGLALLAKQNAILLLPPALVTVYLTARQNRMPQEFGPVFLRSGFVVLGVFLGVAGWWFFRNHVLYGDPLGQQAFNRYFSDTRTWAEFRSAGYSFQEYLSTLVWPVTFASFWGWFGHLVPDQAHLALGAYGSGPPSRWGYPPKSWLYPLLGRLIWLAALGGVLWWVRRRGNRGSAASAVAASSSGNPAGAGGVAILGAHALFVVCAFLNFNTVYFQAQGRYLFPAMAAISLALAGGWLECARTAASVLSRTSGPAAEAVVQRWETVGGWGIMAAVLALAGYALFGVVIPGFSH